MVADRCLNRPEILEIYGNPYKYGFGMSMILILFIAGVLKSFDKTCMLFLTQIMYENGSMSKTTSFGLGKSFLLSLCMVARSRWGVRRLKASVFIVLSKYGRYVLAGDYSEGCRYGLTKEGNCDDTESRVMSCSSLFSNPLKLWLSRLKHARICGV
jgi:hypothetical protein